MTDDILAVDELVKHFRPTRAARRAGTPVIHALCSVSLTVGQGETVGIVGESGSGKSTLLRTVLGLERPTSGAVIYRGARVSGTKAEGRRQLQREVSVVFQDPYTSLDPRMTVADILMQPAKIQRKKLPPGRVGELLDQVRLPANSRARFPHEFSGGQRQRIAIARALCLDPSLIVLDEPVSALDVSVQAEVLEVLRSLQQDRGVSYLFVAHDLAVVADLSHRVGVMYGGQMVETGETSAIMHRPEHPYTRALLRAVPVPDPQIEKAKEPFLRPLWPTEESQPAPCPYGDTL